eukprot:2946549-Amphidinium_carterae.1
MDPNTSLVLIPQVSYASSWIWMESRSGTFLEDVAGVKKRGIWLPFDKPVYCGAVMVCKLHLANQFNSAILYTSKRVPSLEQTSLLSQAGFPGPVGTLQQEPKNDFACSAITSEPEAHCGNDERAARPQHVIGASTRPRTASTACTAAASPLPATSTAAVSFEAWVRQKLLAIEEQQTEILTLIRHHSGSTQQVERVAPWRQLQGGVRHLRPQPLAFDILYRPPAGQEHHSLFACILACARVEPSPINILRLRRS